ELDKKGEFSEDITRKMGELGLFGIVVSPEYGGHGVGFLAYAGACGEIGRGGGSHAAAITAQNPLGVGPPFFFCNRGEKKKYIPQLCKDKLWAFGLTEPGAGSDSRGSKTIAKKVDGGWKINGAKIFITNASNKLNAGVTVQAVTGSKGEGRPELSCFIV